MPISHYLIHELIDAISCKTDAMLALEHRINPCYIFKMNFPGLSNMTKSFYAYQVSFGHLAKQRHKLVSWGSLSPLVDGSDRADNFSYSGGSSDGWEAEVSLARFLCRYCHIRPHSALGGRAPKEAYIKNAPAPLDKS